MLNQKLILCPSARLARSIQSDIARQSSQSGQVVWQSPAVMTLSQWLDGAIETALLAGQITQVPPYALSPLNEQWLWQEVIIRALKKNAFGALFDVAGLAQAAMEANRYQVAWRLDLPREHLAEESRQFKLWQRAFVARCAELNVLEHVRYVDWQLAQLAAGLVTLPEHVAFAGFDQTAPQELRLREILTEQGVTVSEYMTTTHTAAQAHHLRLENQESELRAAVAWAKQTLQQQPQASLAIVVPQLDAVRNQLADLLDDVFYPESVRPSLFEVPRNYNFSLGTPLAQQPIIQAALNVLRLMSNNASQQVMQQTEYSAALLSPFWSASTTEADARAMLDAAMRDKLPLQFKLTSLLSLAEKMLAGGLPITRLLADLNAAIALIPAKNAPPSHWVLTIARVLEALQWPGERPVTSLEYQAQTTWHKALQQLAQMDVLQNNIGFTEAVNLAQQICSAMIFQAETKRTPAIQILGIMEALSSPVDAVWCMHMNDHIWPPPARPNSLLPAFIQRQAHIPNADNTVQAAFAATIHTRLLHSAQQIVFSSSTTAGESQLRPSPLMKNIPNGLPETQLASTLAEQLSIAGNAGLTFLEDAMAPAIQANEHVRGGTGLFKAQAVCPAWAFYQYRLGAKALKTPTDGLDNMARGSLVHGVLEQFWHKRHFADLRDMPTAALQVAVSEAVDHTLQAFSAENSVSANVLTLEHERLFKLISDWLLYEKSRNVGFNMVACEAEKKVSICGIEVTLKIDRIHTLENGGLEFVDYKTGQAPKMNSWAEARITEPQLPIYAVFYVEDAAQATGVQFGMVKTAEHTFAGVSAENFEAEPEIRKPAFIRAFNDWTALLTHWKSSIEAIAQEIKNGEAAVRFKDEKDLAYCEVMPLLRIPERKLQFERYANHQKAGEE